MDAKFFNNNGLNEKDMESFNKFWFAIQSKEIDNDKDSFKDVMTMLTSGSYIWADEDGYDIETFGKDYEDNRGYQYTNKIVVSGGELEEKKIITLKELPKHAIEFTSWWLARASEGGYNKYITQASRHFLGGDFDAWACSVDEDYTFLFLQYIVFGDILYA